MAVETFKKCTSLWREANVEVKMVKAVVHHVWTFNRTTRRNNGNNGNNGNNSDNSDNTSNDTTNDNNNNNNYYYYYYYYNDSNNRPLLPSLPGPAPGCRA